MLIDSHCHLPLDKNETEKVINAAKEEGVVRFITIGTSLKENREAIELAEVFPEVYATVAVYPHEDMDKSLDYLKSELQKQIDSSKKVVAVGECGIDISNWEEGRKLKDQIELFEMQINLAVENKLPLVLHNRNGDSQVLELFERYKNNGLTGVAHCFASSWEVAQKLLDLNFYISFSAMITYPSRKELLEVVEKVPFDRFLVETDAPYLPPQGLRGQQNEPKYVKMVAQKVAEVKNLPTEKIAELSYNNTLRLFNL